MTRFIVATVLVLALWYTLLCICSPFAPCHGCNGTGRQPRLFRTGDRRCTRCHGRRRHIRVGTLVFGRLVKLHRVAKRTDARIADLGTRGEAR